MVSRVIAVVLALAVSGCTTWTQFREQEKAAYVGKPVENMLGEWGAPYAEVKTSSGWYYEFMYIRAIYRCEAKVWTDADKVVQKMLIGGQNGCPTG